jgi:hypothetical protein
MPFVASNANWGAGGAVTVSLNSGSAANRCIVALAAEWATAGATPVSATYAGITMSNGTLVSPATGSKYRLFYLLGDANVAAGVNNLAVALTGSANPNVVAASYSGISAISGEVSGEAVSTTPSWTVASAAGSEVVVLFNRIHGALTSSTPAAPAVSRWSRLNGADYFDSDIWEEPGAASVTINGTIETNPNPWFGVAISLAGMGGGGGGGVTLAHIERSAGRGAFRGQY